MPTKIGNANLYSVPEVANLLEVTTASIRNYINRGHLKGRKLTGRWFITEDELNEFVNKLQNSSYRRNGQIEENYEQEIKEIMTKMECPRDFSCCKSDLKPRCEVKDVDLEHHLEIAGEGDYRCKHLVVSNRVHYCRCPLCIYLTKKLGQWDFFTGTKRFVMQKIFPSKQEDQR
jgi:predicted transcriptional regulator